MHPVLFIFSLLGFRKDFKQHTKKGAHVYNKIKYKLKISHEGNDTEGKKH